MPHELMPSPFVRAIHGLNGTVLGRIDEDHMKRCAVAIRRRSHPAWSQMNEEIRVGGFIHEERVRAEFGHG